MMNGRVYNYLISNSAFNGGAEYVETFTQFVLMIAVIFKFCFPIGKMMQVIVYRN